MCQVQLEKVDNYILATLSGELILGCTREIKEKVKEYADTHRNYHLVVDLSGVTFIDSSGLGILIAWFKMANQQQGKVAFCNLTAQVRKIIGFAKLDKIFTITDTLEEAIAGVK